MLLNYSYPLFYLSLSPLTLIHREIESLTHSLNLVNSVDKLIEACEAPRTIRMPRTVQLVKQLRKELNFSDIVKSIRKKGMYVGVTLQ